MALPELISQREYARRRGISNVSVHRAVVAGRITTVDGKIDPAAADRDWAENTDQSKPRNRITGRPKQSRAPGEPSTPMSLPNGQGETSGPEPIMSTATGYAKARAARETINAQLAKLELDRERGLLVPAADVRVAAFNSARKARDLLMAVPERIAVVLAATDDPGEVQRLLEEEIEVICLELSE